MRLADVSLDGVWAAEQPDSGVGEWWLRK